jgi:hypothetical protein
LPASFCPHYFIVIGLVGIYKRVSNNTNKRKTMSNTVRKHRLKADEQKLVLSYVKQKTLMNRLSKELEKMKQNVVDLFEKAKQNVIIVQDENGENLGLQKINRKRQKFETSEFKLKHNDLYYQYCTMIQYDEYKVIGGTND